MAGATIAIGLCRYLAGTLGTVGAVPDAEHGVEALSWFMILRAFSSGCTALTGVEAISNGITAFKEPASRNAGITLVWVSGILGTMFLGITVLAQQAHALPSHTETVISQLGRVVYGSGSPLAILLLGATTLILIMRPTRASPTSRGSARFTRSTVSCPSSSRSGAAGWCTRTASSVWRSSRRS
jgi:amino acid transporter